MIGLNLQGFSQMPGSLFFYFSDPCMQGLEGAISSAIFIHHDRLKVSGIMPDSHCPVGEASLDCNISVS